MRKILVLGATSVIAQEVLKLFARDGDWFFLVARDAHKLSLIVEDLRLKGAGRIETFVTDMNDYDKHALILGRAREVMQGIDILFSAYGRSANQKECERDFSAASNVYATNFISVASFLTHAARQFEIDKWGIIAVISSAAGDKPRGRNYVYASSKAALSSHLEGLRDRLSGSGVHVMTIKPGHVETPINTSLKGNWLWAKPETVGKSIYKAICNRRKRVLYVPWFWCILMKIISIRSLFKK